MSGDFWGLVVSPQILSSGCPKRGAGFFLPGVLGVSPNINFPHDWGIEGVEKEFSDNLITGGLI